MFAHLLGSTRDHSVAATANARKPFRPGFLCLEDRTTPSDLDVILPRPGGMPMNIGDTIRNEVGQLANELPSVDPSRPLASLRQMPGQLWQSARSAQQDMTWELMNQAKGLLPYPQLGSFATMLNMPQMPSPPWPVNSSASQTYTDVLYPGDVLVLNGTAVGTMGQFVTVHVDGSYRATGVGTDDGLLESTFTVDNQTGFLAWAVHNDAKWSGTQLLYDTDKANSHFVFDRTSDGVVTWSADGQYTATKLLLGDSTLSITANSTGDGAGVKTANADARFSGTFGGGGNQIDVDSSGAYARANGGQFNLDTNIGLTLKDFIAANDKMEAKVRVQVSTTGGVMAPPSVTADFLYTGTGVFTPDDKATVRVFVESRPGIPVSFTAQGTYDLSLSTGGSIGVQLGSGSSAGLPTASASVYISGSSFISLGVEVDPTGHPRGTISLMLRGW